MQKAVEKQKKQQENDDQSDLSVLQMLLRRDPDERKAAVMASDMMLAGVDTVRQVSNINVTFAYYSCNSNLIMLKGGNKLISCAITSERKI